MDNFTLPGNPRYQPAQMQTIFGYDMLYKMPIAVELATLKVLADIGVIPEEEYRKIDQEIIKQIENILTTEVDVVEKSITHHDVRALVQIIQGIIQNKAKRWVHVPLTSYDPLDTGRSLQFLLAYQDALKPSIKETVCLLIQMIEEHAGIVQIGRTHGQHALPITIDFWLANILNRILYNWIKMDEYAQALQGKISGAVGAYNAQVALGFEAMSGEQTLEERVLEKLGLKPAPISTQILPPDPLAYFLFSCTMMSASLAQFARDCRHLMRSEIAEVSESFGATQVGSSTMANKRNPITFENIEGTWLKTKNEFGKVLDTLISEHQRDLVGSSLLRDFPIIPINLQLQLNTLNKTNKAGVPFISRITIDKANCERNFRASSAYILAEPIYIAMQMAGYENDAHELVNRVLMKIAKEREISLFEALEVHSQNDVDVRSALANIPAEIKEAFRHPETYTGKAEDKAKQIVVLARETLSNMGRGRS